VLGAFVKQASFNLLSGKSAMDIAMPINIFQPKSFVEVGLSFLQLSPFFLEKAA